MHRDGCELTDQIYTSVPSVEPVLQLTDPFQLFLAAAWMTLPAREWERGQVEACAGI